MAHIVCVDHHNGRRLALLAQKGEILVRESEVIGMSDAIMQLLLILLIILAMKKK